MEVDAKLNRNISNTCRVCLEDVSKLYPLEGPIANVDVHVSTMIAFCTSIQIEVSDDLPNGVCIPCFRTIRIAYNFINRFKESHKLLTEEKWKYTKNLLKVDNDDDTENYSEEKYNIEEPREYNGDTLHEYKEYVSSNCSKDSESPECYVEGNDQLQETEEYINNQQPNNIEVVTENFNDRAVTLLPENIQLLTTINCDNEKSSSVQFQFSSEENNQVELTLQEDHCPQIVEPSKLLPKVTLRRKFIQQFSCPKCPGIKHTEQNFLHHISAHQGETFHCNMCTLEDNFNVDEFMDHFIKLHRYQCPFCKKNFSKKGTQYAHMKTHNNVRYSCSFPDCNKSFVTSWSLRKHQNIHSDTIRYSCEKCNVSFKTYDTYRYHLKTHNGRNFLCPFCGKTYLQSVHLKHHMWQHTGLKQFKCILCSKSYTGITQLKKHTRKFHGNN